MKKIILISLVIILAFCLFLFAYYFHTEQEHSISRYGLSKNEMSSLHNGDIILRHGYGMASDIIVNTLNEKYDISHCAIICKESNQINVIHSVSQSLSDFDGVQTQSINRFIKDSKENSVIVVRYKNPTHTDNKLITERAKYYLSKKIPFDNDFNIKDSTQMFCTELIWKTIKDEYGVDLFKNQLNDEDKKNQYKFHTFWDTTQFEIILNHQLRKQKKQS
ncbi:MAG: YiiX/YebB-like N1pC/P60 family cysteine hydrolase [Bacteroidales bacterium]